MDIKAYLSAVMQVLFLWGRSMEAQITGRALAILGGPVVFVPQTH